MRHTKRTFTQPVPTVPRSTRYLLSTADLATTDGSLALDAASSTFAFRSTDYYASLIDWNDPADPIRRLIVPSDDEAIEFGSADPSDEASNTKAAGLQHKYADTALLLVTDQCAGFCRYCFRKRLFTGNRRETLRDWRPALAYIAEHSEITDVLLTGGDPLTLPTHTLRDLIDNVMAIDHVRTIRIGSKVPAFEPGRINFDPGIARIVSDVVESGRSFHVMTHFDHPHELTPQARHAVRTLREAGALCLNQCPITAGINDNADALAELFQITTEIGAPQYYVFQCRPTSGNASFTVPLMRTLEVVEEARSRVSGLARRARLCMSHTTGKVEILGADDERVYARYHRAKNPADENRMLVFKRDDSATWLDDLQPA